MLLFALALSAHAAPVAMDSRPDIDGAALQRSSHQVADEFGVPEKILLAIAYEASHFDPTATSAKTLEASRPKNVPAMPRRMRAPVLRVPISSALWHEGQEISPRTKPAGITCAVLHCGHT